MKLYHVTSRDKAAAYFVLMERTGIEPVTPCLQSTNRALAGADRR